MRVSSASSSDSGFRVTNRNFDHKKYKKHLENWCNSLSAGKVGDILKNTPSDIYVEASLIISLYDKNRDDYLSADEVQTMKDLGAEKLSAKLAKRQNESLRETQRKKNPVSFDMRERKFKKLNEKFCRINFGDKYKPHSKNFFKA